MASAAEGAPKVVPAQLSFLAIYNPELGKTDEEFKNQIVFYYSGESNVNLADNVANENENSKLRHVGLAQGMVDFARTFSNGAPVDSVETEKTRVVLQEIEEGWWILASIDLTCLPVAASTAPAGKDGEPSKPTVEYSSREVSPPALLLKQLSHAHNIFLLHHGSSLQDLFAKLGRDRFCNTLDRFWTRFAQRWDVLLHGSPAVEAFGGMKLAAGGELGIGVGEEEWGSGEREVLEDFANRTDGLVDVVVSRYGAPAEAQKPESKNKTASKKKDRVILGSQTPWMGSGQTPDAQDGVVFSGVDALSRSSLRDISHWMEWIYAYGEYAYGVRDNPSSDRRKRRRRDQRDKSSTGKLAATPCPVEAHSHPVQTVPPGIPRPIVSAAERSLERASRAAQVSESPRTETSSSRITDPDTWKYYLTFGYASTWGGAGRDTFEPDSDPSAQQPELERAPRNALRKLEPTPHVDKVDHMIKNCIEQENKGFFVVGLKGDMDEEEPEQSDDSGSDGWNGRIFLRTLYVKLRRPLADDSSSERDEGPNDYEKMIRSTKEEQRKTKNKSHTRLRVVVYVHRPFIYTFLFNPRASALTIRSFYQNLHTYFSPLHRPLSASTCPSRVAARIAASSHAHTITNANPSTHPIFDLVFDPTTLTTHSSIPNIPEPGMPPESGLAGISWTRVDALNVHSAILDTVARTRTQASEIERTGKTSRAWWVVWMRLPASVPPTLLPSETSGHPGHKRDFEESTRSLREAFLVRRARDGVSAASGKGSAGSVAGRAVSGLWKMGMGTSGERMGGKTEGWGPRGVAEGIGIDARRYVEGLLSLNR